MFWLWLACTGPVGDDSGLPTGLDTGVPTVPTDVTQPDRPPPNLLVLIADDVGIANYDAMGQPADAVPDTPVVDALMADGMQFRRAYANPTCSPTRFTGLTGRYARRRGVGRPIFSEEDFETPLSEVSLAQVLAMRGYTSVAIGKWHLASDGSRTSYDHPLLWGFSHHGSLQRSVYWDYVRNDDGEVSIDATYQTTAVADDIVHHANTLPEPWLLWAGFHAAHTPMHVPPDGLNPRGVTEESSRQEKYFAMIEAMDLEIGRVLASIGPDVLDDTIIVFFGDNGTIAEFVPTSWVPQAGKGSTYEGGTRVPFVVSGPGVAAGTVSETPIHTVDLFPTLVELAGIDPGSFSVTTAGHWDAVADGAVDPWLADWNRPEPPVVLDGVSFAATLADPAVPSPRRYVFTERFYPKGAPPYPDENLLHSVRDDRFKLSSQRGVVELFDLHDRHDDGPDLLLEGLTAEASAAYDRLGAVMDAHLDTLVYEP